MEDVSMGVSLLHYKIHYKKIHKMICFRPSQIFFLAFIKSTMLWYNALP